MRHKQRGKGGRKEEESPENQDLLDTVNFSPFQFRGNGNVADLD